MRRVLSFVGALTVSYISLRIVGLLIRPVFNFFDQGTPDPSEAARYALDFLMTVHGILAIGLYGLFKRSRRITERVSDYVAKQHFYWLFKS